MNLSNDKSGNQSMGQRLSGIAGNVLNSKAGHTRRTRNSTNRRQVAPLTGDVEFGRLVFPNGIANSLIEALERPDCLYSATFDGPQPDIAEFRGKVDISFPRVAVRRDATFANIAITTKIPWTLEVRKGTSRLTANLKLLQLREIRLSSGVRDFTAELPATDAIVPIDIFGGAREVNLALPQGAYASLSLAKGAAELFFDGQYYRTASGPLRLDTQNQMPATGGYRIRCHSGVRALSIISAQD